MRLLHLIVVSLPNCKTIGFLLKTASVAAAGLTIVSGGFNMDSKSVVVRLTQVPRPLPHPPPALPMVIQRFLVFDADTTTKLSVHSYISKILRRSAG